MVGIKEKITLFAISIIAGVLWPITAFADPVTVAVVAGAAAGASAYYIAGATLTAALVYAAGSAALTYYSASQAADIPDFSSSSFGNTASNRAQMVKQAITNRRIIYGQSKVSGPLIFIHTTASDDILHIIVAIAGHEIDGFDTFYINDEEVFLDGDPETGLRTVTSGDYANDIKIQAFKGTDDQTAVANLISEASDKWTSDHRLRGTAYFYARLDHNTTDFPQGIPQIKCIVRGKKVYDPRVDATTYSDNPSLCFLDYLKETKYGLSCSDAEIDLTAITAGANLADEIQDITATTTDVTGISGNFLTTTGTGIIFRTGDRVEVSGTTIPTGLSASTDYYAIAYGTNRLAFATSLVNARARTAIPISDAGTAVTITRDGEPRYTVNGTLDSEEKPKSVIAKMLTAQGASMAYSGGKFVLIPAQYTEPTLIFDEDDLRSGLQVSPKTGRRDRFNAVKGVIADPTNDWQPTDYAPFESTQFATQDGETIFQDVAFEYCISPTMAQRLAKIVLLDSRQEMLVNASMKLTGLQAQIGDIIRLSNDRFGFEEKTVTTTLDSSNMDTSTDEITFSSAHGLKDGEAVTVSLQDGLGTLPTPLSTGTRYRIIKVSDTVIKLASTFANAVSDTAIDVTAVGGGILEVNRAAKAFRVIEFQFAPSKEGDAVYMGCDLTLKECDDSVYDFDTSEETLLDPSPNTNLPSPFTQNKPPSNLQLESGNEALRVSTTGTVDVRIKAMWDAPINSFTLFYELEYKESSQSEYQSVVVSSAATQYFISGVTEGVNYDVRVRAVNSMGVKSAYVTETAHTVVGKTEPPPDVQTFAVSVLGDGTRRFTFDNSNFPADVLVGGGVRIRYASDIDEVWGNMTALNGLITSSPFETSDIPAGSYRFAIRMENSSGVQSVNPLYITATLAQRPTTDAVLNRIEQDLNWEGTYTNAWLTPENTLSATATETWADLPNTWEALDSLWAGIVASNSPLTYETPVIDLGQDYVFTPSVTVNGSGTQTIEMKTGDDADGSVTGSYTSLAAVDGVRYIQIKVTMTGSNPYITSMSTVCTATFLEQDYTSINTATYSNANFNRIAAGHFQIATTQNVSNLTRASLVINSGGALFYNVVSKTETVNGNPAAEFKIFDSSETLTDATVDISLRGPQAPS